MSTTRLNPRFVIAALVAGLLLALALGAMSGSSGWLWPDPTNAIFWQLRLPRVLLAALVGAGLACTGAAMQGLCRNPLADPSIVGVTSGASLGATVAIALASAIGLMHLSVVLLGGFAGGVLVSLLVWRLASVDGGVSVLTMLLVGLAVGALAAAVNSGLLYVIDNEALRRISLWQMGGFQGASWFRVGLAALLIAPVVVLLPRFARPLDALLLGESEARHLGVDVDALKRSVVILVALAVAAAVALSGVIAFLGLIVPHALRLLLGPGHRHLLPASALAGGLLLVVADGLSRVLLAPAELPVGILTALLGAPLFISMLRQRSVYLPA